jgi:hypothetical protein
MKDSGVPEGLGMIGHPTWLLLEGSGVKICPGYAVDVQGTVTADGGFAAVKVVIGGKNHGP